MPHEDYIPPSKPLHVQARWWVGLALLWALAIYFGLAFGPAGLLLAFLTGVLAMCEL